MPEQPYRRSAEEMLAVLGSSPAGLSASEAARRLLANGPNVLVESKRLSAWQIVLGQFDSLIVWILIAAAVVSGVLGELVDAIAILAIVVLNAAIGFYQEFNAEKSIAALKKMTAPRAKVRRDGQIRTIDAAEIVNGDILTLEAGDLVAADARLIATASLRCVEAVLTGESEPVTKDPATLDAKDDIVLGDRRNLVFMGTGVGAGTGEAVVVATAMQTELGRIAGMISEAGAEGDTPLQRKLDSFGRVLIWVALGIVAVLFGLGLLRGESRLELFLTAISLAVAAVPEGLPAVVTVALSVGVMRLAHRGALVRRLAAVETLGSTTVICTDKTGTLTEGEMTARALWVAGNRYEVTGEGYGPEGEILFNGAKPGTEHQAALLELAAIQLGCNNSHLAQENGEWKTIGDPTEGALLSAGAKAGGDRERIERVMPKLAEFPFDSDRKRSSVIRRMADGSRRALVNGAPGPLLDRCNQICWSGAAVRDLTEQDREHILAETSAMAAQSLRVLGSAYGVVRQSKTTELESEDIERDLVFVGLTGMYDPPRPEGKLAIEKCHAAGIRVVMITGDHPRTAIAIASNLGITSSPAGPVAVTGVELDKLGDEELRTQAPQIAVYARVTAEHKLRIVRALKSTGAVVAMTGDGVNDAPAIKGADIGIAMGKSGTEVTRQAADMILTDDNFATIVAAVEEGRGIYDNIRKTLRYLLAGNTGELLLMTICVTAGLPSPLLPIHLLWINLATDGLPAICLSTDPGNPEAMNRPPRPRTESITDERFLRSMMLTGVLTAGVAFGVYLYVLRVSTLPYARGSAFAVLVFAELFRSFGERSDRQPLWRTSFFSNPSLVLVVAVSIGLQVASQQIPAFGAFLKVPHITYTNCLLLLVAGAIPLAVLEILKAIRAKAPRSQVS